MAIPLWQQSCLDLSVYPSEEVSRKRDEHLTFFQKWTSELRLQLAQKGYWCDASCPQTGFALHGTRTASTYNEIEGLMAVMGYDAEPIGCCGIVMHPQWRRKAYPATAFTTAPLPILKESLLTVGQKVEPFLAALG